jgi:hypothetical protein
VQLSDEQKATKRQSKKRCKANAAEREAVRKEAKKLQDQAERDRLEVEKERRLAEKQHAAESDPKLLEAICKENKGCNDPPVLIGIIARIVRVCCLGLRATTRNLASPCAC